MAPVLPLIAGPYDFGDVVAVLCGVPIISGYGSGESISVARSAESFGSYLGSNGEVVPVINRDRRGNITVRLHQQSIYNGPLSKKLAIAEKAGMPVNMGPSSIRHTRSGSIYQASISWILKPPDAGFGAEVSEREWVIFCPYLEMLTLGQVF